MRLVIQNPTTKAETVLCDGFARGVDKSVGPNSLRIGSQRVVDPKQFMRAASTIPYDRGNQVTRLAFGVARQCASVGAALAWETLHHLTCIRSGTLFLTVQESGERRVQLNQAVIENMETNLFGVTVQISYTIIGGAMQL